MILRPLWQHYTDVSRIFYFFSRKLQPKQLPGLCFLIFVPFFVANTEPNLIGDFSKPFCLPLIDGRHSDLKAISVDTMAKLIRGEFKDSVASYKVIDCRYPYEYNGGHIQGAINMYMQEQILDELVHTKTETATTDAASWKRNILVFHCEFSSERGPKL